MNISGESISLEAAFAQAEAEAELRRALEQNARRFQKAALPDRFNEDWRFGKPSQFAEDLAARFESAEQVRAAIRIDAEATVTAEHINAQDEDLKETLQLMPTIGSDYLLGLHIKRFGAGCCIMLEPGITVDKPIIITYEVESGLYTPGTFIMAGAGSKAHIIEKHVCKDGAAIFCTRNIQVAEEADIAIELRESGVGSSRAFNITDIHNLGGKVRHFSTHSGHAWAREETIAEIDAADARGEIRLYSANKLTGNSVLDQHTRQVHHVGGAFSDLLYKNVVDEHATAIFAGNIYVAPGAHDTDAYQANRNMLLSEKACIHSLPGLEILADRVKCSHGSASAPMDEEQLFYLTSRGINRREAQLLVAEGFLADVTEHFRQVGSNELDNSPCN